MRFSLLLIKFRNHAAFCFLNNKKSFKIYETKKCMLLENAWKLAFTRLFYNLFQLYTTLLLILRIAAESVQISTWNLTLSLLTQQPIYYTIYYIYTLTIPKTRQNSLSTRSQNLKYFVVNFAYWNLILFYSVQYLHIYKLKKFFHYLICSTNFSGICLSPRIANFYTTFLALCAINK